jgi:hypothetical protein
MKGQKKIEIKPIGTGPEHSQYLLTLYDESRVFLVNVQAIGRCKTEPLNFYEASFKVPRRRRYTVSKPNGGS